MPQPDITAKMVKAAASELFNFGPTNSLEKLSRALAAAYPDIERQIRAQVLRELAEEFEKRSREAQEYAEVHLSKRDDFEAHQLARERERVYKHAADHCRTRTVVPLAHKEESGAS